MVAANYMATQNVSVMSIPKVSVVEDGEEDVIAQYQRKLRDQDKANMVVQLRDSEMLNSAPLANLCEAHC